MKKILLIGSEGYIGSRLTHYLREHRHEVTGVDIGWFGVFDQSTLIKDYRNLSDDVIHDADVIILLAGHSGVKMCDGPIQASWQNNVSNFVELVKKMNRNQQLIYASSGSVYGNAGSSVFNPVNNYDITKYVLDLEAQQFIRDGYKILGLRFGTVNGYSDNLRDELMINSMVMRARTSKRVQINNQYIKRPILALSDLCAAMKSMIDDTRRSGIYDLCSFNDRVIDIAEEVCHHTGAELVTTPDREGVYDFVINNERFERHFDFKFKATRKSVIEELMTELDGPGYGPGLAISNDRNKFKEYQ